MSAIGVAKSLPDDLSGALGAASCECGVTADRDEIIAISFRGYDCEN